MTDKENEQGKEPARDIEDKRQEFEDNLDYVEKSAYEEIKTVRRAIEAQEMLEDLQVRLDDDIGMFGLHQYRLQRVNEHLNGIIFR